MLRPQPTRDVLALVGSLGAIGAATWLLHRLPDVSPTTVALALLLVVLNTATIARLWIATVVSLVAMLSLNFFFLPPVGTFTIADPQNWIALFAFLTVAVIASNLSAAAQDRAREAIARRNEVTRLFDLTRDVLLTTETASAIEALARHVARRFELTRVAIYLPADYGWRSYQGGGEEVAIDDNVLNTALAKARGTLEFDAYQRAYGGHIRAGANNQVSIVPLRHGMKAVGLLAATSPTLDIGTLDAVAGVVAIAIERVQFLAERDSAELVRQKADLAATLLASLSHDLRTPLTAIRVAVENLRDDLPADERRAQTGLAITELERLTRLLQDILDMARIDAEAIRVDRQWVAAADVVDAAVAHIRHALEGHALSVDADADMEVETDPRLASVALSHLLENAAQYSAADRPILVQARVERDGLHVSVTDHGPGLDPGSSITCSNASTAAAQPGRRHLAPGWGSPSREVCWQQPADASGPRMCRAPARGFRLSSRAGARRDGGAVIMAARILIVDDEPNILATVAPLLRARGYDVISAMTGRAALDAVERDHPDLIVLDLGLPDIAGVEVCRQVRESLTVPILVLSARGAEKDKVNALDAGADDYVTKPFGGEELLARIRAMLRRVENPSRPSEPIVRGGLVIDRERFRVLRDGQEVRLTPKEFELLVFVAQQPGRVLTHRVILKAIWGPNAVAQPEHLRVLIGSLRRKIEPDPSAPKYILTEPWVGYRFADA